MLVGHKIKKLRELRSLSVKEMADKLGMSISGYHKIERDEVDVNSEKIAKFAEIFEVKPTEILEFDQKGVTVNNNNNQFAAYNINFQSEKELYEKILITKDNQITQLESEIAFLRSLLKKE
jgi:transcriptional regulator with XRE-family HTH domain